MLNKSRRTWHKSTKTASEQAKEFWETDPGCYFSQKVISIVSGISMSTLEKDRYFAKGISFSKVSGRTVYRKSEVVKYLKSNKHE